MYSTYNFHIEPYIFGIGDKINANVRYQTIFFLKFKSKLDSFFEALKVSR